MTFESHKGSYERYLNSNRHIRIKKYVASAAVLTTLPGVLACGPAYESSGPLTTTTSPDGSSEHPSSTTSTSASSEASAGVVEVSSGKVGLDLYYGEDCENIVNTRPTNTISMDYVNTEDNAYSGVHNDSLKGGLVRRVNEAVAASDRTYFINLTDEQEGIIEDSVDRLVDEVYGEDVSPNDKQYYVTVASFSYDSTLEPEEYDTGDDKDDLPVYTVPEKNYCVYDLSQAQASGKLEERNH